jgi:hypothetical protein
MFISCRTSELSTGNRDSLIRRSVSGAVASISRYVFAQSGDVSCTQNSTTPIEYSQSTSGSRSRRLAGILILAPFTTSAYSSIEAFLVGDESLLNGLSGLDGSAACLYSFAANEW